MIYISLWLLLGHYSYCKFARGLDLYLAQRTRYRIRLLAYTLLQLQRLVRGKDKQQQVGQQPRPMCRRGVVASESVLTLPMPGGRRR